MKRHRQLEDGCTAGADSRADVSYVLKGILIAGHEFSAGNDNLLALSRRFIESMRVICAGEQIALDEATEAALREWSSGAAL